MTDRHFVNLHVHSAFSLLDSVIRIPDLTKRVVELGQSACAITDHGNLGGAVKFTESCLKRGIKPLIGQEFYVAPDSRHRRDYAKGENYANHLIIFAKNDAGWRNLAKLSSIGFIEGFYHRPRIDKEVLEEYSEGLIVTSACIGGEIAKYLKAGVDPDGDSKVEYSRVKALSNAQWYMDLFEDDFYFEMQSYGADYQELVNKFYRDEFPRSQLIASADCHYLMPAQADVHDTLLACQTGKHKSDPTRWRFVADTFYLKSEEEMLQDFHIGEVYNTGKLADKIDFILPLRKQFFMPELPVDVASDRGSQANFVKLCTEGLYNRVGVDALIDRNDDGTFEFHSTHVDVGREHYGQRLVYEINTFIKAQYVEYALLLWDLKAWCRREGILCGPGRGSGVGSLVLFSLGITDVDPIARDCPFERFINPGRLERFSPPDVDLDFPNSKRGAVIAYLRERYGHDRVCQIGTYASLGPAALIRKLRVCLGLAEDDVAELTAAIPAGEGSVAGRGAAGDIGSSMTLADVYQQSGNFARKIHAMGWAGERLMEYGAGLAFLGDHVSTHASGIIITNQPVDGLVPLMSVKGKSTNREVMSQMDMSDVEALGLVKFDILGLKTLDVFAYVENQIKAHHDETFSFDEINMDDPAPYRLLHEGRTIGIFQAEGGGFGALLPQVKPQTVEELAILTSLCRPGPMQAGITRRYIERKQGREQVTYEIPQLEPILSRSLGCIVFQEDIMRIASECAGYSLAEADDLRKIVGKKQRDKMPEQRSKFLGGLATICGVSDERADRLWAEIEMMAEYVFNRGHAMAYSYLTARCTWAKYYYPAYFLAAAMTSEATGDGEELPALIQDARYLDVQISRPDINESEFYFHAPGGSRTVRIGLLGVHKVGNAACAAIIEERRRNGPFKSREDFRERVPPARVNSLVMEHLERAGAFDALDGRIRRINVASLLEEFMLFGFFLSGHPCERLRPLWLQETPHLKTIEQMLATSKMVQKTSHNGGFGKKRSWVYENAVICGVVSKYDKKKSKSKAGAILHFIDLEDESGVTKIFLNQTAFDKLGLLSIDKGMGLKVIGSKSARASQQGYIDPIHIQVIPLVA